MALVKLTTAPNVHKETINGVPTPPTITFEIPDAQLAQFIYFFSCIVHHADAILPAAMAISDCITCGSAPPKAA